MGSDAFPAEGGEELGDNHCGQTDEKTLHQEKNTELSWTKLLKSQISWGGGSVGACIGA